MSDETNLAVADTAQPTAYEPPPYVMPPITVGDSVIWYDSGDKGSPGYIGIVVKVDQFSIACEVRRSAFPYKESVRHVTDPKLKANNIIRQFGGWDYSPQMRREFALQAEVGKLTLELQQLKDLFSLDTGETRKKK